MDWESILLATIVIATLALPVVLAFVAIAVWSGLLAKRFSAESMHEDPLPHVS
jgi:hypothetical protein